MATVNFSVPDKVKAAFNASFKGQNKSAVIARLMREAVEEAALKRRRRAAMNRILERRATLPAVSSRRVKAIREALRRRS
jgi:hypothetical protein